MELLPLLSRQQGVRRFRQWLRQCSRKELEIGRYGAAHICGGCVFQRVRPPIASQRQTGAAPSTTAPAAVAVTTAAAIKRELPRFFEATGSLAGDQQTDVAPQTSGKVVAVGVEIGSPVRRGQTLVRLDDTELKLRVDQAATQVEQAKARVRQAEEKIGLRSGQAFDPKRVAEVAAARSRSISRKRTLSGRRS